MLRRSERILNLKKKKVLRPLIKVENSMDVVPESQSTSQSSEFSLGLPSTSQSRDLSPGVPSTSQSRDLSPGVLSTFQAKLTRSPELTMLQQQITLLTNKLFNSRSEMVLNQNDVEEIVLRVLTNLYSVDIVSMIKDAKTSSDILKTQEAEIVRLNGLVQSLQKNYDVAEKVIHAMENCVPVFRVNNRHKLIPVSSENYSEEEEMPGSASVIGNEKDSSDMGSSVLMLDNFDVKKVRFAPPPTPNREVSSENYSEEEEEEMPGSARVIGNEKDSRDMGSSVPMLKAADVKKVRFALPPTPNREVSSENYSKQQEEMLGSAIVIANQKVNSNMVKMRSILKPSCLRYTPKLAKEEVILNNFDNITTDVIEISDDDETDRQVQYENCSEKQEVIHDNASVIVNDNVIRNMKNSVPMLNADDMKIVRFALPPTPNREVSPENYSKQQEEMPGIAFGSAIVIGNQKVNRNMVRMRSILKPSFLRYSSKLAKEEVILDNFDNITTDVIEISDDEEMEVTTEHDQEIVHPATTEVMDNDEEKDIFATKMSFDGDDDDDDVVVIPSDDKIDVVVISSDDEASENQLKRPLIRVRNVDELNTPHLNSTNNQIKRYGETSDPNQNQPEYPFSSQYPSQVSRPPTPILKIRRKEKGLILTWWFGPKKGATNIDFYEIFFCETKCSKISSWKKLVDIKPLFLPMACYICDFLEGVTYHFIVRAVSNQKSIGNFSAPTSIMI